ncbi:MULTISPECIES: RNA 2',3'-cyclic phosphodiesterase [Streptomyces]|uniref:RNA 2',3'-cyclic phosphodiesterase n=1 Tax=Streptomyces TaxID=1883 RepID=UPI0004BD3114|nr:MULTISPECIES: RNA 2',3'-cyclic phosphodiesterase [Streptomyces]KJY19826.1 2'-5' RNA ligase [Streptomyces sp. NRRL S-104]KOU84531.1 2'-5' RNA ligase [Streptomyces sp. XY58]KOV04350.1 2'-5' RNA ligase [Streptomyces sp. XY37]KOV18029.1 2'-5' RNA ligase [Streptomyces sp. XY413]KOV32389.1 2'-5' RNA ligase [Streptomyces sp. H021]
MRLFAAVLPPEEAVAALREAVAPLRDDRLTWTAEAGWHFTLAFMGEVRDDVLPELHARLERAAHRTAPFALRLHGCGHFGDRALWAGAAGELDALRLLADRTDAAARRAGVPMEQHRRYTPHLTLARSRHPTTPLRPYLDALADFEGTAWQVDTLSLVRSNLPVSGVPGEQPRYETVRAWPLAG